ncbi:MAG: hypothetical protein EBS19_16475 [Spirochaetia bacterium]|nr:hypothetical protein [Spirochaetia bacterium]
MNLKFKIIILYTILSSLSFCSNSKEAELKREFQENQILFGVLSTTNLSTSSSSSSGCPKPSITCSGSNNITSFTNLKSVINIAYGTKGDCARSGCHNGSAQFDLNTYSTTINFVRAGVPECSNLFLKVYSGSMLTYSNSTIHEAIYCWILNGAKE